MNRTIILAALLCYLSSACPVDGASVLLDFEDLTLGAQYAHPLHPNPPGPPYFTTSGVTIKLGGAWPEGTAEVVSGALAGTQGNAIWTRVVDLQFALVSARAIELRYGYHGGRVSIEINGVPFSAQSIQQFNGQAVGGYIVKVTTMPTGALTLVPDTLGTITSFHIGGEELAIDDVLLRDVVLPASAPEVDPPGAGPAGSPGFLGIREVIDNGEIADQNACYVSLDSGTGTILDYEAHVLNIQDSGGSGHFDADDVFAVVAAGHRAYGAVDDLSLVARGAVRVPQGEGGVYTFGVNSDDGFLLHFPGRDFTSAVNGELVAFADGTALRFFGGRATADTLGTVHLPEGDHAFWLTYHEHTGDAAVELYAAKGLLSAFDPSVFRLVGHRSAGEFPVPGLCDEVIMTATSPGRWTGGQILNLQNARDALAEGEANGTTALRGYVCVNHSDPQDGAADPDLAGSFSGDFAFPNDTAGDDNDFAVKVTGLLDIPVDGTYQIGFNSDDGASLRIPGHLWQSIVADATGNAVIRQDELINDSLTGWSLTAGAIDLPKGCHPFEAIMFERGGGAFFELFGRGVASPAGVADATWHLLQMGGARITQDSNGLQLVGPPATGITPDQATTIATTFAHLIQVDSVTPRWVESTNSHIFEVRGSDQAGDLLIGVDATTGEVVRFVKQCPYPGRDSEIAAISGQEAVDRCMTFLRGNELPQIPADYLLEEPRLLTTWTMKHWRIDYRHDVNGIQVVPDFIFFLVNAENGEIAAYSKVLHPVTVSTIPVIDEETATALARNVLSEGVLTPYATSEFQSATLKVLYPNHYFYDLWYRFSERQALAWVVQFVQGGEPQIDVWIDALTGDLLGGQIYERPIPELYGIPNQQNDIAQIWEPALDRMQYDTSHTVLSTTTVAAVAQSIQNADYFVLQAHGNTNLSALNGSYLYPSGVPASNNLRYALISSCRSGVTTSGTDFWEAFINGGTDVFHGYADISDPDNYEIALVKHLLLGNSLWNAHWNAIADTGYPKTVTIKYGPALQCFNQLRLAPLLVKATGSVQGSTVTITAQVTNREDARKSAATNVTAKLVIPGGFTISGANIKTVGALAWAGTWTATWTVQASAGVSGTQNFDVVVASDNLGVAVSDLTQALYANPRYHPVKVTLSP